MPHRFSPCFGNLVWGHPHAIGLLRKLAGMCSGSLQSPDTCVVLGRCTTRLLIPCITGIGQPVWQGRQPPILVTDFSTQATCPSWASPGALLACCHLPHFRNQAEKPPLSKMTLVTRVEKQEPAQTSSRNKCTSQPASISLARVGYSPGLTERCGAGSQRVMVYSGCSVLSAQ